MDIDPTDIDPTDTATLDEQFVALGEELTRPAPGECVLCYLHRMLRAFGCDTTLRWVRRWRDLVRPGLATFERRFEARGGFCDCEVFWNGWTLRDDLRVLDENGDLEWPAELPRCAGLGPRSARPCTHWRPRRRGEP
jgi:Protein of unknown function (DUF2695)